MDGIVFGALDFALSMDYNISELNHIKSRLIQFGECLMTGGKLKSKSDLLYERLREEMLGGVYAPGVKLPRESEFARQQNVALLTLRGALSRLESDGLIARLPRSGTFVIGPGDERKRVIQLRIENYGGGVRGENFFNRDLILGVANYAYMHDCGLEVMACDNDPGKLKLQYQQGAYMGIIWDRPQPEVHEYITELSRIRVPQVCINREVPGCVRICCDYRGAICQAMRFLRRFGHRDVALLDLDLPGEVFSGRQREFVDQVSFMGIADPESRLLRLPYPADGSWLMIAERMRGLSGVTAVIVSYTHMEEFIRYAEEAQLNIPGDLSVILWGESDGYNLKNDSRFSILTESRFNIGNRAVELLMESGDGVSPKDDCHLIASELIMRSSCGLPRDRLLAESGGLNGRLTT